MGEIIEELYQQERWIKARVLILRELKKTPDDHWYLSRLSGTYYEQHKYKKALQWSNKAYKLSPNCPLVLWDRAGILDMLGRHDDAIALWRKFLKRGVNSLAYGHGGEGLPWAKSLVNDCRCEIADAYCKLGKLRQARLYIQSYMKHRSLGVRSIYDKRMVKKQFAAVL
jgi:hypothetical protein